MRTPQNLERRDSSLCRNETLKKFSIQSLLPDSSSISFVGIHSSVDLYTIFRPKPVQAFLLRICKMLKECLIEMLGNEQRRTASMRSSRGHSTTYRQIRTSVLSCLNMFMEHSETLLPGNGARLGFSEVRKGSFMSGTFIENGLIGMLQASHLDFVDQASPFFEAVVDVMCGGDFRPKITELFPSYVDFRMFLQREGLCSFLFNFGTHK